MRKQHISNVPGRIEGRMQSRMPGEIPSKMPGRMSSKMSGRIKNKFPGKLPVAILAAISALVAVFLAVVAAGFLIQQVRYPPLPVEHMSGKEALEKLNRSETGIAELAAGPDTIWYITRSGDPEESGTPGMSAADERIRQMIGAQGWRFTGKEGSGLFFDKDGTTLIVTTRMWTGRYVLAKVPGHFRASTGDDSVHSANPGTPPQNVPPQNVPPQNVPPQNVPPQNVPPQKGA